MGHDRTKTEEEKQKVRIRHMFMTEVPIEDEVNIPSTLDEEQLQLINLKFDKKEVDEPSLVDSVSKLIEISGTTPTQSLDDYIEELKLLYAKSDERTAPSPLDDDEVDIEALIQKSEAELLNTKDKRTLLYELIEDVKNNRLGKNEYDDEAFERNLEMMIEASESNEDESLDDLPTVEKVLNEVPEDEVVETDAPEEKETHRKFQWRFMLFSLFVIIGLLVIAYLYKDAIFAIVSQIKDKIIE